MQEKRKSEAINGQYEEFINKRTDDEILEILKKRSYYQSEMVNIALKEAIKRNLIESEKDLEGPTFRVEPLKPKLFPGIENEAARLRIRKSLGRSFIIAGALPLILGLTHLNAGNSAEGALLLLSGLLWMLLSGRIMWKGGRIFVNLLLAMAFLSVFYVVHLFQTEGGMVFLDFFIAIAAYLLLFYGLLFLRRLTKK